MSQNGIILYNGLVASLPDGVCSIRIGKRNVIAAWTSGLDIARIDADEGQVDTLTGAVRFLTSDLTASGVTVKLGDKIEIKQGHDAQYQDARVAGRFQKAGAIRLELGAEFE